MGSIDYKLDTALLERGMPVEEFAKVAAAEGIRFAGKSRLFEAFRGVKPLPTETATALWALWTEIEAMCLRAGTFRLDLSDGLVVRGWLEAARKGSTYFVSVDLSTEEHQ